MTLWAYPMDETGCGSYRVRWPMEALRDCRGLDVHIADPNGDEGIRSRLNAKRQVTQVRVPEGCTGVLVQRPTSEMLVETLTLLKRSRLDIPLIVDVDDDLSSLSAKHPAFHHLHPRSAGKMPGHSAQAVHNACAIADLVICSTPALLERYAKHGRGVVLENRLPRHLVSATPTPHPRASSEGGGSSGREAPSHTAPRVRLGWPASLVTHPDDLTPVLPALHRLRIDPLHVLGPHPHATLTPEQASRSLIPRLPYPHMRFARSPVPFSGWIPAISSSMDVAIAPLEPSRFNAAKSWLKPLELSIAGVPFVASDMPEYRLLNAGIFARKPDHWTARLRDLLNDKAMRRSERDRNFQIARACTYDHPEVLDDWATCFKPWLPAPGSDGAPDAAFLTSSLTSL